MPDTPVPPEIVEKAERAVLAMQNSPAVVTGSVYVLARVVAERVLAAVYGDIVEAARRDALTAAARVIGDEDPFPVLGRSMVVVTDQAAEYVTTFARVRALCDAYRANCDPTSRQAEVAELFRAALDGTEATP